MQIRPAFEADIAALQTLLRNSWLTTWAPALQFATVQRFAQSDPAGAYASDKWRDFIVAEEDGVLLGMFHVENNHLHAIHLRHDRRRHGIGSRLMDDVERRIAASGYREAELEVRAFNTNAIAFYKKRGWTQGSPYMDDECGEAVQTYRMVKSL